MKIATRTSVERKATPQPQQVLGLERVSEQAINSLRAACEVQFSTVIDVLIASSVAEADAALERARTAGQSALDVAIAALQQQTGHKDELTESVLQLELRVEELELKLQEASRQAKEAHDHHENERSARARAEAACGEAREIRAQVVSAYEEQLHAVQAALDAASAEATSLQQQLDSQWSERARLLDALKVVQQACAFAESNPDAQPPRRHDTVQDDDHEQPTSTRNERAPEIDLQTSGDSAVGNAVAASRSLTLVPPAQGTAESAPPELVEYVKQLFEQIESAYWVDHRAHASTEVVDNLCVNLRYARDVFERRVGPESTSFSTLFQEELTVRLDAHGATSLGRHLAVAAYELAGAALVRAEAS